MRNVDQEFYNFIDGNDVFSHKQAGKTTYNIHNIKVWSCKHK